MVYSGAGRKLIHGKNLTSKISWHCPFKKNFFSYQVGFEDITGGVDGGLVLGHEEHGQQVAGEAQGQDQRQQLPHAKKQARRNV
jgi:hypothetical protein